LAPEKSHSGCVWGAASPSVRVTLPGVYILIVDDDARIVELVAWFLVERGFRVDRAAGFVQARTHLEREMPDLMLSDIDLGAEDGREELWSLARAGMLPPTLVVSGYLSAEVLAQLNGLPGLVGTLSKPFDFEALEAKIHSCLAAAQGARGLQPATPARAAAIAPAATVEVIQPVQPVEDDDGWIEVQPALGGE
jgi:DNA-binding response OmpR family regulator